MVAAVLLLPVPAITNASYQSSLDYLELHRDEFWTLYGPLSLVSPFNYQKRFSRLALGLPELESSTGPILGTT